MMQPARLLCVVGLLVCAPVGRSARSELPTIREMTEGMVEHDGFFRFYWSADSGKIWLEIPADLGEFLYVNWLSTGLGSNPVGLDRGQLGRERIVKFVRVGPRAFLHQDNQKYRALTPNSAERRAVAESFAQSILWSAQIHAATDSAYLVDLTPLLTSDVHNVVGRMSNSNQGSFQLDSDRSAVYLDRTQSFPRNSEFEATLTFQSNKPGPLVGQTTPTPESVTLRLHHSFVELPDDNYKPRRFDPRTGSFHVSFYDFAAPLDQPIEKKLLVRHRLQKHNPEAPSSDPVEPIVYYVDPGAPEQIRQALIEGAAWWNEAFEAAGFTNAFQVKTLPDKADPLDVRFNVIQWVHRSTRGWSYGNSVVDPRTGEIIKGHVTLGSLRVRQDRLLFEGLGPTSAVDHGQVGSCSHAGVAAGLALDSFMSLGDAVDISLDRIRQLSAHEVGHTLGFAHNFAASTYGRASVMDYPAPLVKVTPANKFDFSNAYDKGIGAWDKFSVQYAYSQFPPGSDESALLDEMVAGAIRNGMVFLSDADARPLGATDPRANLWDNGSDPVAALKHELRVRRLALDQFGLHNLRQGAPLSELEQILVPLYLRHRYQVEATAKLLGGAYYSYAVRGDGRERWTWVPAAKQRQAIAALLTTLTPNELALGSDLIERLFPRGFGDGTQERFPRQTGQLFDPQAIAQVAADVTLRAMLHPERASRMTVANSMNGDLPGLDELLDQLLKATWTSPPFDLTLEGLIHRAVCWRVLERLLALADSQAAAQDVRAITFQKLRQLGDHIHALIELDRDKAAVESAFWRAAGERLDAFFERDLDQIPKSRSLPAPPGSPIGGAPRQF